MMIPSMCTIDWGENMMMREEEGRGRGSLENRVYVLSCPAMYINVYICYVNWNSPCIDVLRQISSYSDRKHIEERKMETSIVERSKESMDNFFIGTIEALQLLRNDLNTPHYLRWYVPSSSC